MRPFLSSPVVLRPLRPLLMLSLLLVGLLAGGCSVLPAQADDAAVTTWAAGERAAAPELTFETLDGAALGLDALEGPVVVNFWASWCGPCRLEAPHLTAVALNYADEGVSVLGVNSDDTLAGARSFAQANLAEADGSPAFPSWFDPEQRVAAAFGPQGPVSLPTTLILDREHRVAVRILGGVTGATLAPYLDQVLTEA